MPRVLPTPFVMPRCSCLCGSQLVISSAQQRSAAGAEWQRLPLTNPSGRQRHPLTYPSGRQRLPLTNPSQRHPLTNPSERQRHPLTLFVNGFVNEAPVDPQLSSRRLRLTASASN